MFTIRVAILNRPLSGWKGGDLIGISERIKALRALGVDAVYTDAAERLEGFDLCHIFHLDHFFCPRNFEVAQVAGKPYVVTPVFYPENVGLGGTDEQKRQELLGAAAILPYSNAEGEELRARFGPLEYTAIPSGTAAEFHAEFSESRRGVCTADQSGSKNADTIRRACSQEGYPFGCFQTVPHEDMPRALRSFRVFCSATHSDRMSLSVGEALCSGCRVITTPHNRGNEWYPGIQIVEPWNDAAAWARAIRLAYDSPDWDWTPNEAARKLTWEAQAAGYKAVYERVLHG